MAVQTSSLIGANLSGAASDATALFALGTVATGTEGSRWEYVEATSTFITGELVLVNPHGTAKTLISSILTANTDGYDLAAVQGLLNQGEFGWVAKQGRRLYVLVTGSHSAADNFVALGANSGRLIRGTAGSIGMTMLGVFLTTGISGGASAIQATLTWPRIAGYPR